MRHRTLGDATVVAAAQDFHWAAIDDKATPEISDRFNVGRFPSLLVVGPDDENVYRWRQFMEPDRFLARLAEAKARWKRFRTGEPLDPAPARAARLWNRGPYRETEPVLDEPAMPQGLVRHQGRIWAGLLDQGWTLPEGGGWELACALPAGTADLTSDGTHIFALPAAWPGGQPVAVIDPATDTTVREITTVHTTRGHPTATGIAWQDGSLWVLEGALRKLHQVDPETGRVTRVVAVEAKWCTGLAVDGPLLVSATHGAIVWIDPATGLTMKRVAVNYRLKSLAIEGRTLYAMEEPVEAHDAQHEQYWAWPERTVVYELRLP